MANYQVAAQDSSVSWSFPEPIKLVWTDPPFGTNKIQDQDSGLKYRDVSPSEAKNLILNAVKNIYPYMTRDGVICICADHRIIHTVIHELGQYLYHQGDIVWTFGLGRPRTNWWPVRHNTIATFTLTESLPTFDKSAVPTEIRKAPKAGYAATKPAGSVWDYTMSNTDRERVGYPNQKPISIIEPFILAHTKPGDTVADPFCGSGSIGAAALKHGRRFLGQDISSTAIKITNSRLAVTL